MLLSSSMALSLAVTATRETVDLDELHEAVDELWRLSHSAEYDELGPRLIDLIPRLEAATRAVRGESRQVVCTMLARTYHACSAALVKLGELAAAWVAADRAISAAEQSGDLLLMAESAFRQTLMFQASRQYDHAERTTVTAIQALKPLIEDENSSPGALSITGVLHLQLAVIAARQHQRERAFEQLRAARSLADRLGRDRNDYNTEFGPTNVALHEVAVAVDLGDPDTALQAAAGIDASGLSSERRGRLLIDVTRAHLARRENEDAIRALLEAERVAPGQTGHHRLVRNLLRDLDGAGYGNDPRVRGLVERLGLNAG
jgi:tetratricopeptide (TPR) repeat protein